MTVIASRPVAFGLRERRARRRSRRPLVTPSPSAARDALAALHFFLIAYAAGLVFFLVMLS